MWRNMMRSTKSQKASHKTGGGLGLLIRWVWVFVVVGAWWWLGFGYSVGLGLGLCGGGCVVVAWVWVFPWVWVFVVVGAWWWLGFGSFRGFGSLWWWVRGGGLGLGLSVGLGLCGGGCVVVAWVWVFGGFGSLPWWVRGGGGLGLGIRWVWVWVFVVVGAWWWLGFGSFRGFGSLWWWVRGGGLGLGIRWVWVFAVVGAWWWLGFVDSVGLGLCGGGLGLCGGGLGLCGGTDVLTGEEVAIKLVSAGIPNVKWSGVDGNYNVLVMDLLGDHSLEELLKICGNKLSLKSVLMLADQMVFIIDFGLATKHRHPSSHNHIPYSLPWQIKAANRKEKSEKVKEIKDSTCIEDLCHGFPIEFSCYIHYCRSLSFDTKPDYGYLKRMFRNLFSREGFKMDYVFDWTILKYQQSVLAAPPDQALASGILGHVTGTNTQETHAAANDIRQSGGEERSAGNATAVQEIKIEQISSSIVSSKARAHLLAGIVKNSLICGSLLCEVSSESTCSAPFGGEDRDGDVTVILVAVELNTSDFSAVLLIKDDEEVDVGFFRDRTPHKAVIIAIVAAIPRARSENESAACIKKFTSVGILLPMTKHSKQDEF
uniref:Uncharacterized protein n=1 Tax=Fagus sylvatica TaxID=28930 RepID=A0A2N9HI24_FAGSY